jgi:hypothetical protein
VCQGIRLACLLAATAAVAGAADPPPGPAPGPVLVRPFTFTGTVVAVEPDAVTVRGFDLELRGRGRGVKVFQTDDGQAWVSEGEHTVLFFDRGPLGEGTRTLRVARSEQTKDRVTLFPAAGGDPVVLELTDQPARRFPVRGPLAAGGYPEKELPGNTYRLADLAVGDRVGVTGKLLGEAAFAESLSIHRRPGGRVPPAPADLAKAPPLNQPYYHEMQNAEQDWEDHGIPLPKGYHEFQRWVHPAPPPREVVPKPSGRP